MADLHPGIAGLAPLLGTWTGSGRGEYPTIESFGYTEEISFSHNGKPFLIYTQRTRSEAGAPLHAECGYLRTPAPGRVELVLAHPTGITEIDEGTVAEHDGEHDGEHGAEHGGELAIDLRSTTIGRTATAKDVAALSRSIRVVGDELTYTIAMAAVGQPLQHHLAATLRRST